MSCSGKRKDSDSRPADGDGDAPPTKSAKQEENEEDDNILVCEFPTNRRVSVKTWKGKVLVDIREYYPKDGKLLPSRKGISLTIEQWKVLRDHVEEIDKVLSGKS